MSIQLLVSSRKILYKIISIFFMSAITHICYGDSGQFRNCSRLYNCGSIQGIGYPFWGDDRPDYCGSQGFSLLCSDNQHAVMFIDELSYRVLRIDPSIPKMTLARSDLWNNSCPTDRFLNTTLPNFSTSARNLRNLNIFYGCTSEVISKVQVQSNVTCSVDGSSGGVFFSDEFVSGVQGCNHTIVVPILLTAYNDLWDRKITLGTALDQGFDVEYNAALGSCSACEASGGKCGSNWASAYQFICICRDQSYPLLCPNNGKNHWVKISIGAIVAGAGLSAFLILCYFKYKKDSNGSILLLFSRKTTDDQNLEAIIKQYGSFTPRRYSYSEIKKMTNSFKEKLGKGGYGDVYKGFLLDGHPVAVKILNTSKGNGEEFINEVASISRTSHVNIVSLLGFCLDGHKRALIYDFMPNGSLEKYIRREFDAQMGLQRLYEIAIGIARGLEYLHRGCNTRILHFDIKPHNILLDENFCPKISDFGLAKLCTRKESIVSMLGARGTIGYIAPEVFSRNFGGVSYKSDVYSYGTMVLEMIEGRMIAIDVGTSNSTEAYFPYWVYQHIILDEDLKLADCDVTEQENEIARKMILVGLWCIQTDPSLRPSMSRVIDMLEGSLSSLEVPPKPFFYYLPGLESLPLTTRVVPQKTTLSFPSTLPVSPTTSI